MTLILGFELTTWLIGTLVAVAICYWYKSNANHYWKSKDIPSDAPKFSIGRLGLLTGKSVWELDEEQYKKHGKICGIYQGATPMLLVSDPELIKTILVKDFQLFHQREVSPSRNKIIAKMMSKAEGEEWKRLRSILTPIFTSSKLRKLATLINKCCESTVDSFVKIADSKEPVDLRKQYNAFALDVMASTVFGTDLDSIKNPDDLFVIQAHQSASVKYNWKVILFVLAPKLMKKLGITLFPKYFGFFADLVLKNRKQRKNGGKVRDDLLQMLMDIESEAIEEKDAHEEKHYGAEGVTTRLSSKFKKSLTADELVAQCVMFFLAGSNTTATTLSLISYLLALNSECQNRLVEEVDQTWEKYDGMIDYDAVNSMEYSEAVIAETLRLYPATTRLKRTCVQDYALDETGIFIPKGVQILVPIYAMQRDQAYFNDPEKFNPERFLPENINSIQPYTYLPFGSGRRNCIGMRFAQMEIKLCLVHILRQVTFEKCQETQIPLQYKNYSGLDLIQPTSVTLCVKRRR